VQVAELDATNHRSKYRRRQLLLTQFWKRWKHDYLLQLRNAMQSRLPARSRDLQVGELVLVNDDFKPRMHWKMGLVHEVYPGRDGKVRSVTVRLPTGDCIKRPAQLLYPLEVGPEVPSAS